MYVAIIEKAAIDLRRDLRPWTGASRAEKNKSAGEANDGYEDFFQIWLQRQGIVSNICQRFEYVVESDVSNFFGSIDPGVLQEFLQGSTSLHRDVVRLCVHLIRRTLRHPEYAESPALGLPQEGFGASRAIGHALLCEVDREFDHEGADGIYGRFMDDFVTGADEVFEAEILISRLQHRLERLGLYPNSAKTKIVRVSEFLRQSMASENVFLDEVDSVLKECETGTLRQIIDFPDECLDSLLERANAFRGISPINRPERYDRLLRRYYTLFRRLGRDDWLPHAIEDVSVFPSAARNILEYLRSFPLTVDTVNSGFEVLVRSRSCYHDVPLLVLETLVTAPNHLGDALDSAVVTESLQLARAINLDSSVPRSLEDWLTAGLIPLMAKYGESGAVADFLEHFVNGKPAQSVARLQALPLQVSLGFRSSELFKTELAGLTWSSVLSIDFVRAIESADNGAVGTALGLLDPQIKLLPNRYYVHARPLLFMDLLERVASGRLGRVAKDAIQKLESNPPRLVDERILKQFRRHLRGIG